MWLTVRVGCRPSISHCLRTTTICEQTIAYHSGAQSADAHSEVSGRLILLRSIAQHHHHSRPSSAKPFSNILHTTPGSWEASPGSNRRVMPPFLPAAFQTVHQLFQTLYVLLRLSLSICCVVQTQFPNEASD